jgi:hypothetical protein
MSKVTTVQRCDTAIGDERDGEQRIRDPFGSQDPLGDLSHALPRQGDSHSVRGDVHHGAHETIASTGNAGVG